ncbi:hypothetical protein Lal_00022697 [Lupinus albus]|nr:hypothetical protein Lal_00022697 [Lupinus albus]
MKAVTAMDSVVSLRVIFEEDVMLSKSRKKEGLNRCWVLLKHKEHCIVSHFSSHLLSTFNLHHTSSNGIVLSMDSFVLQPFDVQRKGSISTDDNPALLPCAPNGGSINLPKLLAIEGFQGEDGLCKTVLQEDESDQLEEDAVNVESNAKSEKRKASKKLKSQEDENDQLEDDAVNVESNVISKKRKASKKLKSQENDPVELEDDGAVYSESNVNSKKRKTLKKSKSPSWQSFMRRKRTMQVLMAVEGQ